VIDWDVREFEFPDEHGRCLDERQPGRIEENELWRFVVGRNVLHVVVKHDVEAKTESSKEKRVPKKTFLNIWLFWVAIF